MKLLLAVTVLLVIASTVVLSQGYDNDKKDGYGNSHRGSGYDNDKKHSSGYGNDDKYKDPYDHSNIKKTGVYPGSYPDGYNHRKNPGYGPPPHGGYGPPPHGGYKPPHGGYGSSGYGSYGGYGYKYYPKCYPEYSSYGSGAHNLRYLASADEYELNSNSSLFKPPVLPPFVPKCEKGPKKVVHKVYGEWHWPPIIKGECDNLPGCKDPKCISVKTVKKTECVLVFRRYGYRWVRVGFRKITFKTDLKCKCRECKDIKSFRECVHTFPCPNKHNPYSYCYWKKRPRYGYDDKHVPSRPYPPTRKPPTPHRPTTYPPTPKPPTPHRPTTYPPTPKRPTPHRGTRDTDEAEEEFFESAEETFEIDSETEETQIDDDAARAVRSTDDYDRYDRYDKDSYDDDDYKKRDPYDPYKHPLRSVPAGHCACCEPRICKPPQKFDYDNCKCVCPKKKCLPGHKFNPKTCKCECPKGTVLDKKRMRCVGICKKLPPKACEHVICKDNPHFYCKLGKDYKCRCPDCDDVDYWQRGLCKKTKCIKQYYKPKCVFDWRNGKCRCPECEDQKNPRDCEKTTCHVKDKKKDCKWTWYPYPSCVCPKERYGYDDGYKRDGHDKKDYGS